MKLNRYVALAVVGLVLVAGIVFLTQKRTEAPAVSYTVLDGAQRHSDEWRGKVVLVNFWATSCVTCVKEMPEIVATYEQFKGKGYDTVAVAMSYDPPAYVVNFAETRKLPFQVAIDHTGVVAKSFGDIQLTPTSLLIDKRGQIVKRYVGEPDFAELQKLVEKLLAEA